MISIKSDREIELMRQAGKYLCDTFKYIEKYVETGVTTKKLDTLIHDYIVSIGCVPSCLGYEGYPATSCISINGFVLSIKDLYLTLNASALSSPLLTRLLPHPSQIPSIFGFKASTFRLYDFPQLHVSLPKILLTASSSLKSKYITSYSLSSKPSKAIA